MPVVEDGLPIENCPVNAPSATMVGLTLAFLRSMLVGPVIITCDVPRLALAMLTTNPELLTLRKGAVVPVLAQSIARTCSADAPAVLEKPALVNEPAVTVVAVKSGGAVPDEATVPSNRNSGGLAALTAAVRSTVPVLIS